MNKHSLDYKSKIFRSQHDKSNPYVQINKKAIRYDEKLSLEATGLLSYLLCLPDNWEINIKEVATHKTNGIKVFYRVFKELVEAGYIKRHDIYKVNKRGSGKIRMRCDYELGELPYFNEERMNEIEEKFNKSLRNGRFGIAEKKSEFVNGKSSNFSDGRFGIAEKGVEYLNEKEKNFSDSRNGDSKAIQKESIKEASSKERKAAAPSFEKSLKIDIFDFSHPLWGRDKKTYEEVKKLYLERSSTKPIKSKEGWVRECLKNGWHLEKANLSQDENSPQCALNFKFARKLENKYRKLPTHPACDISALKKGISIIWRNEPIKTPPYNIDHDMFKETMIEILEDKGVWEKICRV